MTLLHIYVAEVPEREIRDDHLSLVPTLRHSQETHSQDGDGGPAGAAAGTQSRL